MNVHYAGSELAGFVTFYSSTREAPRYWTRKLPLLAFWSYEEPEVVELSPGFRIIELEARTWSLLTVADSTMLEGVP